MARLFLHIFEATLALTYRERCERPPQDLEIRLLSFSFWLQKRKRMARRFPDDDALKMKAADADTALNMHVLSCLVRQESEAHSTEQAEGPTLLQACQERLFSTLWSVSERSASTCTQSFTLAGAMSVIVMFPQ